MKTRFLSLLAIGLLLVFTGATTLNANSTKKPAKPFLIQGQLPHLTGIVKIFWDDKDLALTKEQKKKLLVVRKETMGAAKSLGKQIIKLEQKIIKASNENSDPNKSKEDVYKLAKLRADATMVHLNCIYKTRKILTKKQLSIIE